MENESKKGYWFVALVVVIIVVAAYLALKNEASAPTDDQTGAVGGVCTQDVKRCADGAYVSRVAPTCEFTACAEPLNPNTEVPADWNK